MVRKRRKAQIKIDVSLVVQLDLWVQFACRQRKLDTSDLQSVCVVRFDVERRIKRETARAFSYQRIDLQT